MSKFLAFTILFTLSLAILSFDFTTSTFCTCYWALDFVTAGGGLYFLFLSLPNNDPIAKIYKSFLYNTFQCLTNQYKKISDPHSVSKIVLLLIKFTLKVVIFFIISHFHIFFKLKLIVRLIGHCLFLEPFLTVAASFHRQGFHFLHELVCQRKIHLYVKIRNSVILKCASEYLLIKYFIAA